MRRCLACLLLLALPLGAETVRFRTDDGLELVADFHRGKDGAATVVCLPMFRHDRSTYGPLVKPLREKGLHVCVLDPRGHGESAPDLRPRATGRDPALFRAMHKDVAAALRFLEERKGCDGTRFGLVGASVGCSVAVDATVRHPHRVRAVVLLTPGANYLGVPTLEHLQRWPAVPAFTFCSFEERNTSQPVIDALDRFEHSSHMLFDAKGIHGTRMFGKVGGIEQLIANFMESSLNTLIVQRWAPDDPLLKQPGFFGRIHRPRRTVEGKTYSLFVWVVGDTWHLGGMVDGAFSGTLTFELGEERLGFPFDTAAKAPDPKAGAVRGKQASFRGKTWIVCEKKGVSGGTPLSLRFQPVEGSEVRLPAGSARFRAVLPKKP